MLAALVELFERVMAKGNNLQKKDLIKKPVKKVVIHDRATVEIW